MNVYAGARLTAGARGRREKKFVDPFLGVLKELKPEDHKTLSTFLEAGRAQDYRDNEMFPGVGMTDAQEKSVLANAPERVRETAKKLRSIYDGMMRDTLVKTGILSGERYEELRGKWPNYVPFMRVDTAKDFEVDVGILARGKGRSLVNLADPIRKARGVANESEVYEIRDPLVAMLRNMEAFGALAARNEVGKAMIEIAKVEGMGHVAEKVGGPGTKGDSVFYVWKDGKREYYATDPDIYAALTAVAQETKSDKDLNKIAKLFQWPATSFRNMTTRYNPVFVLKNFIKDTFGSAINSEAWEIPVYNTVKGLAIQLSGNPGMEALFDEFVEVGGLHSAITELSGYSPGALRKEIEKAFKEGNTPRKLLRKIESVANVVGGINEMVELAPKFQEYARLKEMGLPSKEAALQAREVNIDFARAGRIGRQYNRYVAFHNASVQGIDKTLRTIAAHPVRTVSKAVAFGGLMSLLSYAWRAMGDDEEREEYDRLNREMKDTHWYFRMGGEWLRVPKPQGYGLASSLLERALEYGGSKNPSAFRGFGKSVFDAVSPTVIPNLALTVLESATNYDFFTGRPIVGQKYDRLPADLQYSTGTSEAAKLAGRWAGVSPLKVDHVIRNVAGSLPAELVGLSDRGLRRGDREEARVTEMPFVRSFFTNPNRNNEYITRFYDLADHTQKEREHLKATREGNRKDAAFAQHFAKARKTLSDLYTARAKTQQGEMPPEAKRNRIDAIDKRIAQIAETVVKRYDRSVGVE
jgi:hypothetical protein